MNLRVHGLVCLVAHMPRFAQYHGSDCSKVCRSDPQHLKIQP